MWIKDERMSTRVTDSTGAHAFALINKATGQALKHAPGDLEQVDYQSFHPNRCLLDVGLVLNFFIVIYRSSTCAI